MTHLGIPLIMFKRLEASNPVLSVLIQMWQRGDHVWSQTGARVFLPCPGASAVWASPVVACCAVVVGDVCEVRGDSEEGVLSVLCSGACVIEHLQQTGGPTAAQTEAERSLGLELPRDRAIKRKFTRVKAETYVQTKWKESKVTEMKHTKKVRH